MKNVIKVSTAAVLFAVTGAVFALDATPVNTQARQELKVAQNTGDAAGAKTEKNISHKDSKKSNHEKRKSHHAKKASHKTPQRDKP
ncbi:MAG: hypothetical protein OEW08_04430 [Gammaproteobacteria bacterium]|nr:hypothetical protein [Gammaproteobacteria bacterium]